MPHPMVERPTYFAEPQQPSHGFAWVASPWVYGEGWLVPVLPDHEAGAAAYYAATDLVEHLRRDRRFDRPAGGLTDWDGETIIVSVRVGGVLSSWDVTVSVEWQPLVSFEVKPCA